MFEHGFRSLMYVLMQIKCIIIEQLCKFFGGQRYKNMDTAHRAASWGKWVFGIANSATRYLVKYWPCGVTSLTRIHTSIILIVIGASYIGIIIVIFYRFVY